MTDSSATTFCSCRTHCDQDPLRSRSLHWAAGDKAFIICNGNCPFVANSVMTVARTSSQIRNIKIIVKSPLLIPFSKRLYRRKGDIIGWLSVLLTNNKKLIEKELSLVKRLDLRYYENGNFKFVLKRGLETRHYVLRCIAALGWSHRHLSFQLPYVLHAESILLRCLWLEYTMGTTKFQSPSYEYVYQQPQITFVCPKSLICFDDKP